MSTRVKELWQNDKWFRILSVVFLASIIIGIGFQNIWGLDPTETGTSVLGGPDDILTIDSNTTVFYSTTFNSSLNFVGFVSTEEIQVYLVEEALASANTTYLVATSIFNDVTTSMSQWYEDDGPLSLVLNNTSDEAVDYRFEFRVYDESDLNKFVNHGIGGLLFNLAFIVFGISLIWYVIMPRIPYFRRD